MLLHHVYSIFMCVQLCILYCNSYFQKKPDQYLCKMHSYVSDDSCGLLLSEGKIPNQQRGFYNIFKISSNFLKQMTCLNATVLMCNTSQWIRSRAKHSPHQSTTIYEYFVLNFYISRKILAKLYENKKMLSFCKRIKKQHQNIKNTVDC